MSEHEERVVVVRVTYERLGEESVDDVRAVCAHCLAKLGLLVADDSDDLIGWWDAEAYPFEAAAKPGETCYRPGPAWPPSLDEVNFRRGEQGS